MIQLDFRTGPSIGVSRLTGYLDTTKVNHILVQRNDQTVCILYAISLMHCHKFMTWLIAAYVIGLSKFLYYR